MFHHCLRIIAAATIIAGLLISSAEAQETSNAKAPRAAKNDDATSAPGGTHKVVFKKFPDGDLFMEIDLPKGDGPFPIVIYIHGGGWSAAQAPSQFKPQSLHMAQLGVAGARILYRGKQRGGFDETMADVMDAIDYVRQNAAKYHFDMKRLALAGGSAGAHLAGIAAQRTTECVAFVGFNGLYDVIEIGAGKFGSEGSIAGKDVPFLGKMTPERQKEVSAMRQIKTPPPATILFHGTADTTIDPQQSVRFAEAVKKKGGQAEVKLYDGEVHGFFNQKKYTETLNEMEKFLLAIFQMTPSPGSLSGAR